MVDELRRHAHPAAGPAHASLEDVADVESCPGLADVEPHPADRERGGPGDDHASPGIRVSALMISSARPSQRYVVSFAPVMLANGSTAIEGLSRSGRGARHASIAAFSSAADWKRSAASLRRQRSTSRATSRREPRDRRRRVGEDRGEDADAGVAAERPPPGQHLVEDRAEAEQVAAHVDGAPAACSGDM